MICKYNVKKYCRDDISKIENYEQAINDKEHKWDCHHRLELTLDGEYAHNIEDLKRMGMYYDRPYFELIFIKHSEHVSLHTSRQCEQSKESRKTKLRKVKRSDDFKRRLALRNKNNIRSIFGIKFKEHYGITKSDNTSLYHRESHFYHSRGYVSWEKPNEG